MSTWSFKKQFKAPILVGQKRTTIRAFRKDGRDPLIGHKVTLYSCMRRPDCEFIACVQVIGRKRIWIEPISRIVYFSPDGTNVALETEELERLALADGFKDVGEFWAFFVTPLSGYLYEFALDCTERCGRCALADAGVQKSKAMSVSDYVIEIRNPLGPLWVLQAHTSVLITTTNLAEAERYKLSRANRVCTEMARSHSKRVFRVMPAGQG